MNQIEKLKQDVCEIGRRIYLKGFAAANEGNLSVRLDDQTVLCTPTLHCKGFMTPEDLCVVDMEGNQISGKRKRTSEVLLHLEIYKQRPDVHSVVHCHPPHATAFAVAREPIPVGILPEPDIFLGEVPIAPYETPGSQYFADTILPLVQNTNTIVLANHGTVSFEADIERAYWLTEILDAYCRILILSKQIGHTEFLPSDKVEALLQMRVDWGFDDSRIERERADGDLTNFAMFKQTWESAKLKQRGFRPYPSETISNTKSSEAKETQDNLQPVRLAPEQLADLADLIAEKLNQK